MKKQVGALLDWYDRNARTLPWRTNAPDPYRVWLSEIMLQQTTVPAVMPYFIKFLGLYPTVFDLAAAPVDDVMHAWAGLGYYSRARNLHACARVVANELGGVFPSDEKSLLSLPGVGPYTASAIRAIAFGAAAVPLDANLERVGARLFCIDTPLPDAKPAIRDALAPMFQTRAGDVAQALMDLATSICTIKSPRCMECPLSSACAAYKTGRAEGVPVKSPKPEKPKRAGYVYWVEDGRGNVYLQRRPPKGLLGGMAGLPTSDWGDAPIHPAWALDVVDTGQRALHVFTHFALTMTLCTARVDVVPDDWFLAAKACVLDAGLPTVFKKAAKLFFTSQ